jgi:hypothetical protein
MWLWSKIRNVNGKYENTGWSDESREYVPSRSVHMQLISGRNSGEETQII